MVERVNRRVAASAARLGRELATKTREQRTASGQEDHERSKDEMAALAEDLLAMGPQGRIAGEPLEQEALRVLEGGEEGGADEAAESPTTAAWSSVRPRIRRSSGGAMAPSTAPSGVERPKNLAPRRPSDGAAGASGRRGSVIETRQCCFGMGRARRERENLANEGVHSKSSTPLPAGSASRLVAPGHFQLALHTLDEPSGPIPFDHSE